MRENELLRVMLVDDESHVREIIRKLIPWQDLSLQLMASCSSAPKALEIMNNDMPDILITDVKMPVMNGIELVHRAKAMHPALQCIILSGYDEFRLAQAAMRENVKDYLLKPCSREELVEALQRCVQVVRKERKVAESEVPAEPVTEGIRDTLEETIRRYVDNNYRDSSITLQYIADEVVHMNAQYIGKRFCQKTGMKFSEYLLDVRMKKAKEYLWTHGNCKMYEVAEAVGLSNNIQYFYHLFKQYNGVTPREYQDSIKNDKDD